MASVRKALFFSTAGKYLVSGVSFFSIIILARLLTPEEIGIYAAAAALVSIAHVIRQFGISEYIASRDECTPADLRGCQGVAILFSWILGGTLALSSDLIAGLYDEPQLAEVIAVGSLSFFLAPLGLIPLSMLRRSMQFNLIMRVNVAQALVGAATTISLAFAGYGPVSMAWGNVANILTVVPVLMLLRAEGLWTLPTWENWRRILHYGATTSGSSIVVSTGGSAPDLMISAMLGFAPLALFSRANGLQKMFNETVRQGIVPVVLPALSKLKRTGAAPAAMEEAYSRGAALYTGIAIPFFGCLAAAAEPVILFLFGPQWVEAVPLVPVLCLAAAIASIVAFHRPLLLTFDRPGLLLKLSIASQLTYVAAIGTASLVSIMAVAVAVVASRVVFMVLALSASRASAGIRPLPYLRAQGKSVMVAGVVTLASVLAVELAAPLNSPVLTVIVVAGAASVSWVVGLWVMRHVLWPEIRHLVSHLPFQPLRPRAIRNGGE